MIYYESIQNAKPDMNVIPACASLNEAVFYILEANEKDFTDMITNIGLKELGVFESTGNILLYEDGSTESKNVAEAKESFISKAWARIKALFETILRKIKEIITKVQVNIGKKALQDKAAFENGFKYLSDDYSITTYRYPEVMNMITGLLNINSSDITETNKIDQIMTISKSTDSSSKNLKGGLQKITVTKQELDNKKSEIFDAVKDFSSNNESLSKLYKFAKSTFNDLIKKEKSAKSDDSKEKIQQLRANVQNLTKLYNHVLVAYYDIVSTDLKIIVDVYRANKKHKPEDNKVQESVESLFDWTY